jgi:hypothetical protein
MVLHVCNLSTWEAEAEGSQVQGQPGSHSKTLFFVVVVFKEKALKN